MPWIPLHKLGRSTGRSTPNQSSIDALNTTTPNWADLPPVNWAQMPWIPLHQTWQIYWQIYPQSIKHRCLEYCYTKLGRSTPHQSSIDALNTTTPNWADLPADLPPINQALMPWILLHQTGQIYWQIYPQSIKHRCLEYHYTKLGRSTPQSIEHRCLEYHYTKLGRSTGRSTPNQSSIDALNTTTPNWADLPPSQLSIDALNTTTPNLPDLHQRTSTYERPFTHEGNYLVYLGTGDTKRTLIEHKKLIKNFHANTEYFTVSSAKQHYLCYYTSYIPVTLQESQLSSFTVLLYQNTSILKIIISSSLHFVELNTWSKHHGYSWYFYYANAHSHYNTEPKLTTLTKHSHTD